MASSAFCYHPSEGFATWIESGLGNFQAVLPYQFYVSSFHNTKHNEDLIIRNGVSNGTTKFSCIANLLLSIKMLHPKIFIPNKDIVVRCHNVGMQKPFGIPPRTRFVEKLELSPVWCQGGWYLPIIFYKESLTILSASGRSHVLPFSTTHIHPIHSFAHHSGKA